MSPLMMMVMKEKRDVKPALLKFGMALVLSFAGIIFSRFRTRRVKPTPRLPPPRSSDHGREAVAGGGRVQRNDDDPTRKSSSCCSTVKENQGDKNIKKMKVDTSPAGLSQNSKYSAEKDGFLVPEFDDLVSGSDFGAADAWKCSKEDVERDRSEAESAKAFIILEKDDQQEILQLKNMIKILQEEERNHEVQLLEYYGLKEQKEAVIELQNQIELANMEAKIFSFKIQSLQSENRRLDSQIANHPKTVSELEAAKEKIKLLKKNLRREVKQNKEQILKLKEKVGKLQDQDISTAACDQDMQEKLQRLEDLEHEAQELRECCLTLHEENSDLVKKLECSQILANSVLEDSEACAWKQQSERLREENKVLAKEMEQQLADRCSDLEELVYLRWINACLRYELRNYQPAEGMTVARDLSKTSSPKSEKAKQLILEYANSEGVEGKEMNIMDFNSLYWSSSQASGDCDDSSTDFSSAPKTSFLSKAKMFSKLRKLVGGIDNKNASKRERVGSLEDSSSLAIYPYGVESTTAWRTSSGRYFDYQVQNLKEDVKEEDTDIGLSYRKITTTSRRDSSNFSNSRRHSSDFRYSL